MVDFNSGLSKTSVYQSGFANQKGTGKTGAFKAAENKSDAAAQSFLKGNDTGAVYDKSSVLDQMVNDKTSSMLGKTVGQPELSEKAQKYYDQLKSKFGDMDFILVSNDEKQNAMANAASYANPNKPVVLIGEDEVEKMANDEKFREKYEGIISMAKQNLATMKDQFGNNDNVKGYGVQVDDDGNVSYFAVLKKQGDQQAERIAKKQEEKKTAQKAEEKKEAKKAEEEKLEKTRSKRSEEAKRAYGEKDEFRYEVLRSDSIDDLISKVSDFLNPAAAGVVNIGGNIDFTA